MVVAVKKDRATRPSSFLSRQLRRWTYAAIFANQLLVAGPALACAFDMVKPDRTSIDWIVDAERLVLARARKDDPYSFGVTRVLVDDSDAPPINQLVNRVTRARLERNQQDEVLFAYRSDTGWQRVAMLDDGFQDILDTALEHRQTWRNNMPKSRLEYITRLQNTPDTLHRTLVISELDKVPYKDLRAFDLKVSDKQLLSDLWTTQGYPYQAIRALLLGLSGTPAAKSEIRDYIERVADWDWANNLGAFAAAYIEIEGASGVNDLAEQMLYDPSQPLDKLEQIVMALSVHHDLAGPQLKTAIERTIRELIRRRPETGAVVARQFALRSDWSQHDVLQPLVKARSVALSDLLTISVYMARAREEESVVQELANE